MEFKMAHENAIIDNDVPVALQMIIPTAKPIIDVLTYDKALIQFLKKYDINLDVAFIQKMTKFSFDNHWHDQYPKKDIICRNGSFTLTYTCAGCDVILKGSGFYYSPTTKKHPKESVLLKLQCSNDEKFECSYNIFKCDECKSSDHPLWLIMLLNKFYCGQWHWLMQM